MMLGDAIAATLPGLQAHAESLMVDACLIERQRLDEAGEPVRQMDPETLELTEVWDVVYEGRCRIQRPGAVMVGREPDLGGFEYGVETVHFQLPISAVGIKRDDRASVTAVGAGSDPDLLDVVASVRMNRAKTHATKRTLVCEEVGS